MYRNVVFDGKTNSIFLYTWDQEGNRITEQYPFKPYLYVNHPRGTDGVSIYNEPLKKISFESKKERDGFAAKAKQVYQNFKPEQQFLLDRFFGENKTDDFYKYPLKAFYMDLEIFSPTEFPDPYIADAPISLITVFDTLSGLYYTFGTKPYYGKENTVYKQFENEFEMLRAFMRFWRKDFPDVVITWNGDGFDIPYLINRLNKLYAINEVYEGENAANRLSPVGFAYSLKDVQRRFNDFTYQQYWTIRGVTSLDYMYTYKVFTREKRASYALNYIGMEELGEGKLEHDKVSLSDLYTKDFDKYVDYNVQDVKLLVKLEEKLQYFELCRRISGSGLAPLKEAEGTVGVVTGIVAQKAMEHERIIPTFINDEGMSDYEGGYVREPEPGIHRDLLYFDANSLYPNTIVTLNLSPETKLGKFYKLKGNKIKIVLKSGKEHILSSEDFEALVKKEKLVCSEGDVLFTQKVKGLLPEVIEEFYSERQKLQREIKRLKRELKTPDLNQGQIYTYKSKIGQYNIHQYTWKILLNKMYGFLATRGSPCFDIDLAGAVTATGRACIKQAAKSINEYAKEEYKVHKDVIVYGDTDSVIITIEPILKKLKMSMLKDGKFNPEVYPIIQNFKKYIDDSVNKWASEVIYSKNPRYVFKLENISSAGIFLKKKRYILERIADEDGNPYYDDSGKPMDKKYKYTGYEVVSTTTPKILKPVIMGLVESVLAIGDQTIVTKRLDEIFEEYEKYSIEDIAIPKSLNNYAKYEAKSDGWNMGKGTPCQVKASIWHNKLVDLTGIQNKVEHLKDGDKIKYAYVKKNKYGISVIAFGHTYPEEFKFLEIDRKMMFDKTVIKPIQRIFDAINWSMTSPTSKDKNQLLLMFS